MAIDIHKINLNDWREFADLLHELGNKFNQGKDGYLFWETSGNIYDLIEFMKENGHRLMKSDESAIQQKI